MHKQLQNILVATDFSELCSNAVNVAVKLCKQNNAVLHLLHVVESRYPVPGLDTDISLEALAREIEQEARERLCQLYENVLRSASIPVQLHMPQGIPYDEICRAAEEMPVDLVVLGTHGTSGFREFFMGTTAYSVIKNTIKPVLTIPPGFTKHAFEKILFPVRTVPGIKEKFDYIKPFLSHTSNVSIHIAAITEKGGEAGLLEHRDALHGILQYLEQQHIAHTNEMYSCSNVAAKVLEVTTAMQCDLVVINATLDYKWTQYFIGPFAQQVVNHARVPVLSYRMSVELNAALKKQAQMEVAAQTTSGL